jgi:hypothetical protein
MVNEFDVPRHLTASMTSTACVSASLRQQVFKSLVASFFEALFPLQQLACSSLSCFFTATSEQQEALFEFDLDESRLSLGDIVSSRIANRGGVIPRFLAHAFLALGLKQQQLVQH